MFTLKMADTPTATKTAAVAMESVRLSRAVALKAAAFTRLPKERLKKHIHSLTAMEAASTTTVTALTESASGDAIFSAEDLKSSTPTRVMSRETIKPDMYSIRPWPKGCSGSAGRLAIFSPAMVTTEEPVSDRLLKASAIMDTLPDKRPASSLKANKMRLQIMPVIPASRP